MKHKSLFEDAKKSRRACELGACGQLFINASAFLFGLACVLLVNFSLLFCMRAIFGDSLMGSVLWGIGAGAFSGLFPPSFFIKHLGARSKKTERENVQNGVLP